MQAARAKVDFSTVTEVPVVTPMGTPAGGPVLVFDARSRRSGTAGMRESIGTRCEAVLTQELVERANHQLRTKQLISA